MVPVDLNAVLWVDMEAFRSSPLYEAFDTLVGEEKMPLVEGDVPLNPIKQAEELLLAFAAENEGESDQLLTLVRGPFNSSEVMDLFAQTEQAISEEISIFPAIRTPKFTVLALTEHTLVMGTDSAVMRVAKVARGEEKSLRTNPDFAELSIENSTTARLRYRAGISAPDFSKYSGEAPVDVNAITGLDGTLSLASGLELSVAVVTETQMDAAKLARELNKTRRELGKNMFVLFLGLDWILDRVSVVADMSSVQIGAKLDERDLDEIKRLAARLRKIKELSDAESEGGEKSPFRIPPIQELPGEERMN